MSRRDRYRLDFRALMTQCEENYARLLPLMKALGERDSMAVEVGLDSHPHTLQMRVLERSPYTTTVRLEDQELLDAIPSVKPLAASLFIPRAEGVWTLNDPNQLEQLEKFEWSQLYNTTDEERMKKALDSVEM